MKFTKASPQSLKEGAQILKSGGLVAFPTETVYGLGADAFNPQAVAKIFEVKKRPYFDPLIIHIASVDAIKNVSDLSQLNEDAKKKLFLLAENFWPGPLSIVLPKNKNIPGIATAGLSTAAVRIPDNATALELISLSGTALAAPSANPFGSLSPTRAEHVRRSLGEKIDMIIDGGPARIGIESTVVDITGGKIKILRPGGTPAQAIEKLTGELIREAASDQSTDNLSSPGLLKSHYAPGTPLYVLEKEDIIQKTYKTGSAYLFFDGITRDAWRDAQTPPSGAIVRVLSESGQTLEAASRFFETLHELDASGADCIYAQTSVRHDLGEAINDRLIRASASNA